MADPEHFWAPFCSIWSKHIPMEGREQLYALPMEESTVAAKVAPQSKKGHTLEIRVFCRKSKDGIFSLTMSSPSASSSLPFPNHLGVHSSKCAQCPQRKKDAAHHATPTLLLLEESKLDSSSLNSESNSEKPSPNNDWMDMAYKRAFGAFFLFFFFLACLRKC